ncbi:MAG: dolichyl-phosphate beta-glucosyltransferase [bacterium]
MDNKDIFLSVVIPCYNEEKRLSDTLLEMDKFFSEKSYQYEIIVVDDGSKDKTKEIAENFTKAIKNLVVLGEKQNHGKGFVVRKGMLAAKGKFRLFADADNSTPIQEIDKLLPYFEKGYDLVIGSRAKGGRDKNVKIEQPLYRRILAKCGNIAISLLAVKGIKDTQCGFKCFTKESTECIFAKTLINRWGFDIEALAIAQRNKFKIVDVPVSWFNSADSRVRPIKGAITTLGELLKIRWNLTTGKYK